jgi:hypothetical protein
MIVGRARAVAVMVVLVVARAVAWVMAVAV